MFTRDSSGKTQLIVLIPVFNQLNETVECVSALRKNSKAAVEIVVVDDGSSDGTAAWCDQQIDVQRLELPHGGFTRAANAAFRYGIKRGQPFVLLNNDTIPSKGWDVELLTKLSASPRIGAVGSLIVEANDFSYCQQAGYNHPFSRSGRPIPLAMLEHKGPVGADFLPSEHPQPWLSFTCVAFNPHCVADVGMLDEELAMYYSDTDFGLRADSRNWSLYVAQASVVGHKGQRTTRLNARSLPKDFLAERQRFLRKWQTMANADGIDDWNFLRWSSQSSNHAVTRPLVHDTAPRCITEDISFAERSVRYARKNATESLLCLSPHPDDLGLSMGAFLAHASETFRLEHIVFFTRSNYSLETPRGDMRVVTPRRAAEEGLYNWLHGMSPRLVGLPDQFARKGAPPDSLVENLIFRALDGCPYDRLIAPLAAGRHPDHVCVRNASLRALARHRQVHSGCPLRLLLYEDLPYSVENRAVDRALAELHQWNLRTVPMTYDVTPYVDTKLRRLGIYASQITPETIERVLRYGSDLGRTLEAANGCVAERIWLIAGPDDNECEYRYTFL